MYAKIFHVSTKDLRICAKNPTSDSYKKSSNNPIVDVLRPAQKLQDPVVRSSIKFNHGLSVNRSFKS